MTKLSKLRKLLYRSFEEQLGKEDRQLLNAGLDSFDQLRKEQKEMLELREKLSTVKSDFSGDFEKRVMNAIRKEENLSGNFEILPVFRAVAFSGIAAIFIVLIGVYFADGSLNFDSIMGISRYAPDLGVLAFF